MENQTKNIDKILNSVFWISIIVLPSIYTLYIYFKINSRLEIAAEKYNIALEPNLLGDVVSYVGFFIQAVVVVSLVLFIIELILKLTKSLEKFNWAMPIVLLISYIVYKTQLVAIIASIIAGQ